MSDLHIDAARPLDAGAVGDILSEFIDTTPWMPRVHTRAEDLAHASRMIDLGWVQIARSGEAVLGFLALEGEQLNALYVAKSVRSRGIGMRLLEAAKSGLSRMTLWTFQKNEAAQRFYLRHGFGEVARTQGEGNDEGLPDIRFEWLRGTV